MSRRRSARKDPAAAEDFQVGAWAGHPNYGCPFCGFATLGSPEISGTAEVVAHIAFFHRDQAIAAATQSTEASA